MNNIIAVTIGDINGIGIQILIKLWKDKKVKNFILITNIEILKKYLIENNLNIKINIVNKNKKEINYAKNYLNIFNFDCKTIVENTFKSLKISYMLCKTKKCIGVVTLPLRKDLIIKKINNNFIGQTEFFKNQENKKYANMLLIHKKIKVSPLTTHIALNKVGKIISNNKFIYNQIKNINKILSKDFQIKDPKLAISGLNPHAGENGNIGYEEKKIIVPIINKIRKNNINIYGPFSADSILLNKNISLYDCFIFFYHDQALIPFKLISKFQGVNYTGNLKIIRVSPDHGTAYDLVGKKNVSHKSLLKCFKLIREIYKNRYR